MYLISELTTALTVWIVAVVALVPLAGLTARFGLKPVLDSVARLRRAGSGREMDERFAGLEEQIRALAGAIDRLSEGVEGGGARSAESRTRARA
jgi:peptidoglycan/LPS O-acetylase OafA/YrhL